MHRPLLAEKGVNHAGLNYLRNVFMSLVYSRQISLF